MKQLKRSNIYKASNVTFDPKEVKAYSYNWWCFVRKVGKLVVFNDFYYSPSTKRHQSKVQQLMRELGITIDHVIHSPQGLYQLESSIAFYTNKIKLLEAQRDKPRTRADTNARRNKEIQDLLDKRDLVRELREIEYEAT